MTSELRSFDERSTDSSKRICFSGEAEVPTLSFPSVSIFFFYCKSCLESFGTIIAKKFVLDFSHVGVKTSPLSQLSHARSKNIWRCFVYDELKRKDFFLNFKFTATFHKVSVVVFQNSRETQHTIKHTLSRAFPDDSQSELFLTVAIVKQPIKALSTNS